MPNLNPKKLSVLLKTSVMGKPIVYSALCAHSMYRFSVTVVDTLAL